MGILACVLIIRNREARRRPPPLAQFYAGPLRSDPCLIALIWGTPMAARPSPDPQSGEAPDANALTAVLMAKTRRCRETGPIPIRRRTAGQMPHMGACWIKAQGGACSRSHPGSLAHQRPSTESTPPGDSTKSPASWAGGFACEMEPSAQRGGQASRKAPTTREREYLPAHLRPGSPMWMRRLQ